MEKPRLMRVAQSIFWGSIKGGHYITNPNNVLLFSGNPSKLPFIYLEFALFDAPQMGPISFQPPGPLESFRWSNDAATVLHSCKKGNSFNAAALSEHTSPWLEIHPVLVRFGALLSFYWGKSGQNTPTKKYIKWLGFLIGRAIDAMDVVEQK